MFPIHDDTQRLHGRPYVTYFFIGVNVIVFLWELAVTNFFSNEQKVAEVFFLYGAVPDRVVDGDIFSLITSMFLHGGVAHIIGNMVFLFIFGDNIEDRFGHIKYIFIYLFWGIAAGLVHSLYAVSTGTGDIPAVGASGAISGILGAYLILFPRAKIYTVIAAFMITTVRIPALAYIPFWFIMQIVLNFIQPLGVAYMAHIGGFIAGAAFSFIAKSMFPSLFQTQRVGNDFNSRRRFGSYSKFRSSPKTRYKENFVSTPSRPDIIEGKNFYEILVEVRGFSDTDNIKATFETTSNNLRIFSEASGDNLVVRLPTNIMASEIIDISCINGIARIRLSKI